MRRLPFSLPEFTRVAWVSDRARDAWAPRLERIGAAWTEVQWLAVPAGLRSCAVLGLSDVEYERRLPAWRDFGLDVLGLAWEDRTAAGYTATARPARAGAPRVLRLALGPRPETLRLREAWNSRDHETIGTLLGYPPCCRAFFTDAWVTRQITDPTWLMTGQSTDDSPQTTVTGPSATNLLWRWLDVRAVPHLPCHPDCRASVELGEALWDLGAAVGYADEMRWSEEILSWPVEWSALHGIAEIRTPVLKVSTRTDATADRLVVRRTGDTYPAEGAVGLSFPYRSRPIPLAQVSAYQRGLESPITPVTSPPDWYHRDNGFISVAAMRAGHAAILTATPLDRTSTPAVLDLGCGNGALLQRLRTDAVPGLVPYGIDLGAERIEHAAQLLPAWREQLLVGDLFTDERLWTRRYDLVLLGAARLSEVPLPLARSLLDRIAAHADAVLLYNYSGPVPPLAPYGLSTVDAGAAGTVLIRTDQLAPAVH